MTKKSQAKSLAARKSLIKRCLDDLKQDYYIQIDGMSDAGYLRARAMEELSTESGDDGKALCLLILAVAKEGGEHAAG
jgi:hypothetical protein